MDYIDKPLNQEKLFSALERASAFLADASGLSSEKSRQISSRIFEEFAALLEKESPEAILAFAESALPRLSDSEQSLDSLKDHCGKIIYMTLEAVQERFPSAFLPILSRPIRRSGSSAVLKKSACILWKPSGKPVFL